MSEFNMEFAERKFGFNDLNPTKVPKVPVYRQLVKLLNEELGTVVSTTGQTFACFPTPRFNFFTHPLDSPYIKSWLIEHHTAPGNPPPSNQQMKEAIRVFEARSIAGSTSGRRCQINVRTAWTPFYCEPVPTKDDYGRVNGYDHFSSRAQSAMIFSLDTRRGHHVAITRDGWSLQPTTTEFAYDPVQQPLPDPEPQSVAPQSIAPQSIAPQSIAPQSPDPATPDSVPDSAFVPFRRLLRLDAPQHDKAWKSLLAWILAAMRPAKNAAFHDYPILNLVGPANSGKTVAAKLLAQLIDPTGVPIHSLPTTERRLHVLAAAHHVLAFDNPGKINPEKSRNLSRLSTGVGSLYRQFQGMLVRPIILTTRNPTETKHLATRIVDVEMPLVAGHRSPQEIWEEFEKQRPQILGALLTLLSKDFDAPPSHLPNRKTKRQRIEESIPSLLQQHGGAWSGTVVELQQALNLPITSNLLGRYLRATKTFQVTYKKSDKTQTVTLTM